MLYHKNYRRRIRAQDLAILEFLIVTKHCSDVPYLTGLVPRIINTYKKNRLLSTESGKASTYRGRQLTVSAILPEEPQGQTYGCWAAEWWQWALGVPGLVNPPFQKPALG
jgi:hypothetical protein